VRELYIERRAQRGGVGSVRKIKVAPLGERDLDATLAHVQVIIDAAQKFKTVP
jgi:hypothetical protein